MHKLAPKVKQTKLTIAKQEIPFFEPSFQPFAAKMLGDAGFLKSIQNFGVNGKDKINDETIEFLCPYTDLEVFSPANAKAAGCDAPRIGRAMRPVYRTFYFGDSSGTVSSLQKIPKFVGGISANTEWRGTGSCWQRT